MDRVEKFFVNLAPEPLRNRNPFRVSSLLLILAIIVFLYLDFRSLYKEINSFFKNEKAIESLRKELEGFSFENKQLEEKIIGLKKKYKSRVDNVNTLIEEKNLSWLSLLSLFEESLSERTVLLSLSPYGSDNLNAEISSDNIDDLLRTINKISKNNLVSNVSIVREREKEGQKIFLISIKLKAQDE